MPAVEKLSIVHLMWCILSFNKQKLQSESLKLNGSLRVAQREKGLLQEQLDSMLAGSSQSSSEGAEGGKLLAQQTVADSKLIKQNLSLKKDVSWFKDLSIFKNIFKLRNEDYFLELKDISPMISVINIPAISSNV